jgi:hypothetical protein
MGSHDPIVRSVATVYQRLLNVKPNMIDQMLLHSRGIIIPVFQLKIFTCCKMSGISFSFICKNYTLSFCVAILMKKIVGVLLHFGHVLKYLQKLTKYVITLQGVRGHSSSAR